MRKYLLLLAALAACEGGVKVESHPSARNFASVSTTDTGLTQDYVFGKDTVKVAVVLKSHPDTIVSHDTTFVHDTIVVAPPQNGVDTAVSGDTTKLAFWHLGKIVDSVKVVVKPPPPTVTGQVWGPHGLFDMSTPYAPFSVEASASNAGKAGNVLDDLTNARDQKVQLILGSPCGSHNQDPARRGNCLRDSSGIAVFSWKRFDSTLDALATSTVKTAISKAVSDKVLLGWNILDEPWVKTTNNEGNTWGPNGLSRAQADTACQHVKQRFPDVPVGLSDQWSKIWPVKNGYLFKFCDFGVPQYTATPNKGPMRVWRDSVLAIAKKGGYKQLLSFNIINYWKDTDATYDCLPGSGVKGSGDGGCVASPQQVLAARDTLGNVTAVQGACGGVVFWRYDKTRYAAVSGLSAALSTAAQKQKALTTNACKRR